MVYLRILPQFPRPAIPRDDSPASNSSRCASTLCQPPALTNQIPGKAYEIEEDPDVSTLYHNVSRQLYTRASLSGKPTILVEHRILAQALI